MRTSRRTGRPVARPEADQDEAWCGYKHSGVGTDQIESQQDGSGQGSVRVLARIVGTDRLVDVAILDYWLAQAEMLIAIRLENTSLMQQ